MFNREQIDQVRSRADIVEVIREYVPSLKASGRSVKGLCPFHSERTPSFYVHPEKGLFKCFGCGESGDVIAFISKMEQLTFSEALRLLAERTGVRLEEDKFQQKREPEGIREKVYRVLEAASKIYEDQLWDDRLGQPARSYLDERFISDDTRQAFHLGFAAHTGGGVFETLVKKGFAIELCQQAGLVARSNSGRFYDPMFGRLIFPIFDSFGHVIGFGGRVLPQTKKHFLGGDVEEDKGPKYLNSPETPVFSKGKSLYGLLQAKQSILASRRAVILEGYMDVIGVHQGGVTNAVATLGTAFTRDHAKVLKRYASDVTAFFDPDAAGEQAAMRSLEPMIQEDFYPRVVMTDETGDPDEIIHEKGKEFFEQLIEKAPDFLGFVERVTGAGKDAPLDKKSEAAMKVLALIAQTPNEILKSEWTARLAADLGLRVESLQEQLKKKAVARSVLSSTPAPKPIKKERTFPSAEEEILVLLMSEPRFLKETELRAEDFTTERERRLFAKMSEQFLNTGALSIPKLVDDVTEAEKDWVVRMSLDEHEFEDPADRYNQLVRSVRLKKEKQRLQELSRSIAAGTAAMDVQMEYKDLLRRIKGTASDAKGMVTK